MTLIKPPGPVDLTRELGDPEAEAAALQAFLENRTANVFFGVYPTWDEAAAHAQSFGRMGYDNELSASLYDDRVRMDAYDYAPLCWLLRSMHEGYRSIADVGGSIGIKYLAFREALQPWADMRWMVHDVPAAVERGRATAKERPADPRLGFAERFDDCDGVDILFVSGTLQYLPQTLGEMLSGWRRLPKRILINTTPIHHEHSFFTINSLGTAFCPYRVQTQSGLIRGLSKLGYRLRESWINPGKEMVIPLHVDYSLRQYSGFCLDLKTHDGKL